jgi:hypothetical protein
MGFVDECTRTAALYVASVQSAGAESYAEDVNTAARRSEQLRFVLRVFVSDEPSAIRMVVPECISTWAAA